MKKTSIFSLVKVSVISKVDGFLIDYGEALAVGFIYLFIYYSRITKKIPEVKFMSTQAIMSHNEYPDLLANNRLTVRAPRKKQIWATLKR